MMPAWSVGNSHFFGPAAPPADDGEDFLLTLKLGLGTLTIHLCIRDVVIMVSKD